MEQPVPRAHDDGRARRRRHRRAASRRTRAARRDRAVPVGRRVPVDVVPPGRHHPAERTGRAPPDRQGVERVGRFDHCSHARSSRGRRSSSGRRRWRRTSSTGWSNRFVVWPRPRSTRRRSSAACCQPGRPIGQRVARAYDRRLFHGATLQNLPADGEGPRFVINATNVQTGKLYRFSRLVPG